MNVLLRQQFGEFGMSDGGHKRAPYKTDQAWIGSNQDRNRSGDRPELPARRKKSPLHEHSAGGSLSASSHDRVQVVERFLHGQRDTFRGRCPRRTRWPTSNSVPQSGPPWDR